METEIQNTNDYEYCGGCALFNGKYCNLDRSKTEIYGHCDSFLSNRKVHIQNYEIKSFPICEFCKYADFKQCECKLLSGAISGECTCIKFKK